MLYRFSVENFKSFKERSEISFIPGKEAKKHIADADSAVPVLRTGVIYGANASGKSNFIKAMDFAQELIMRNDLLLEVNNLSYKLDKESVDKPSIFSFEIKIEECLYQYGMAISFKNSMILEEWLFQLEREKETEIFSRSYNNEKKQYDIDFQYDLKTPNKDRYKTYKGDLVTATQRLVLTELADKKIEADCFKKHIDAVFDWFKKLIIIFPTSKYNLLGAISRDPKSVNQLYKSYFEIFDIDIEDIHLNEIDVSYISIPQNALREIKSDLLKEKQENEQELMAAMVHDPKQDYLVELDDSGELKISEVRFTHKEGDYSVELTKLEESDGTQRLFDLIPMMGYVIKEDRVVIIDEIERSLHTLLTRKFFDYFFKNSQTRKSQLICSTHDVLLLDSSLLEKEEIWLVQKKNSSSTIYSMNKFNFPNGKIDIVRNYLLGRFGAIPSFND